MSLRRNILANYVSQIYVTVIGIVILPLYLKYMGAEAYGLVGFFTMLQAWFNLLDMGLTPTVARETARFNGGGTTALSYRQLVHALSYIFWTIALVGGCAMFTMSAFIASSWLKVQHISIAEVKYAVQLMALTIALRWVAGLYRGCISGAEHFGWLSSYNIFIATIRFAGMLVVFFWLGTSLSVFFSYQLYVSAFELIGLILKTRNLLPKLDGTPPRRISLRTFSAIGPALKFSMNMAFLALAWVLITQTDKLILSALLPLEDYGYYSLAVLIAGGVLLISAPVGNALMPRMAMVQARGEDEALILLYRNATQLAAAIVIPISLVLGLFAEKVVWILTNDIHTAAQVAPVLRLYALGNGALALGAFPYYLQYAKGDLRLHVISNIVFILILIPCLVLATLSHGALGAGYAWLIANIVNFIYWPSRVHNRLVKQRLNRWVSEDILAPSRYSTIFLLGMAFFFEYSKIWPYDRFMTALLLGILAASAFALSMLSSNQYRHIIFNELKKFRQYFIEIFR